MISPKDELFNKEMWDKLNSEYITQTLEEMYGKLPVEDITQKELKTETMARMDELLSVENKRRYINVDVQKELKTETKEMWDAHWEEDSNI